jgi:hypothetical protein
LKKKTFKKKKTPYPKRRKVNLYVGCVCAELMADEGGDAEDEGCG